MRISHLVAFRSSLLSFSILFLALSPDGLIHGQDSLKITKDKMEEKDLGDVIRMSLHKPAKIDEGAGSLLLLPIIGSNPATGFMLGIGGQYAFRMDSSTLYSAFMGSVQLTTKSQVLFF